MMPSATPTTTINQTLKPKIGFSIDAIVGNRISDESDDEKSHNLKSDDNLRNEYSEFLRRARCSSPEKLDSKLTSNNNNNNNSMKNNNISDMNLKDSKSPLTVIPSAPLIVPGAPAGLVRPSTHYADVTAGHPHILAQFQAAAALAHVQAIQNGFNGPLPQHLPAHLHQNPNMPRESYPLYPWLLSRHGRIFPHRFPGTFPDFLLQPFRKPKRVRTAFSPSQLLKLEHAFEGNHYVVGAERKTLAQQLSLTETQVKVWFQNRRTKFKRTQQEDSDSKLDNKSNESPKNSDDDDDDEMIDIGDECPSDDEMVDSCA